MRWILLTFVHWACPGGPLAGYWPSAARPLICRAEPRREIYDPRQLDRARARVRELGPGAVLERCQGLRCEPEKVTWRTIVEFE